LPDRDGTDRNAVERLRVVHVAYSSVVWGAEQVILRLAPLFAERGVDVALAAPSGGALEGAWSATALPFVPIDVPDHGGLRATDGSGHRPGIGALAREATTVGRASIRMAGLVRRTRADLVHSHSLQGHLELAVAARLRGRRAVLSQHDLVLPGMGRQMLGVATTMAGTLIAISAAVAQCVPERARSHVDVVHHGVDLECFRPGTAAAGVRRELGGDSDSVLVGILGRVDPSKRVEHVVRAIARLDPQRTRVRLVVVGAAHLGTDDYVLALRREAEQLLADRVRFVAARDDVPEVMRALDVVVNASEAEPFGLTLIEAQASGIPVIAMRSGGAPEIVADGVSGHVVPVGDGDALASALQRLATDERARKEMGHAARRYAEAAFDIRRQADRFVEIYRRTSRRKPASISPAALR
jgi:glycosyltransferase involved in cell wall biosynthesis